jgi:hypothetical protein
MKTIPTILLLALAACGVDTPTPPTDAHPSAPTIDTAYAHCVLCGGDDDPGSGGNGGGGIISTTGNWLDDNYPGWEWLGSGTISCQVTADGNDCSALFQWGGGWVDAGCVLRGDGTHVCG